LSLEKEKEGEGGREGGREDTYLAGKLLLNSLVLGDDRGRKEGREGGREKGREGGREGGGVPTLPANCSSTAKYLVTRVVAASKSSLPSCGREGGRKRGREGGREGMSE